MQMTKLFVVLMLGSSLAGCTTINNAYFSPQASFDSAQLSAGTARIIADDMVVKLTETIGPGTRTLLLKTDKSLFAKAVEEALRTQGYAVAFEADSSGTNLVPLAYTISQTGTAVMVRISTSEVELARSYAADGTPVSPVSVMTRSIEGKVQ